MPDGRTYPCNLCGRPGTKGRCPECQELVRQVEADCRLYGVAPPMGMAAAIVSHLIGKQRHHARLAAVTAEQA